MSVQHRASILVMTLQSICIAVCRATDSADDKAALCGPLSANFVIQYYRGSSNLVEVVEHCGSKDSVEPVQERKVSWSTFNQAVCGLRFLYRITLPRSWPVAMIPFGKRPKTLPAVLGANEVSQLLQCVPCLKHRTLLLTLYAAGLRLSEGAALTIADIDSQRMLLRIACGKGQKERLVPLSPRLLTALREYWKVVRSPKYLFPGSTFETRISSTTIQKSCKAAVIKSGIRKDVTPHTLRHSYATGLLEAGVDLLTIGHLLGHKSFSTTMVYLHVRRPHMVSTPSPIDWLPVRQLPGWHQPDNNSSNNTNTSNKDDKNR
jgi:site-specific recombinase XerD